MPEAELVVGDWRLDYTLDAPAGIPAHVTILVPFVEPERLGEVEERLGEIIAATPAFDVAFPRTARWPEILYLEPEPAEPFVALTHAIEREWPDQPPYGGAHGAIVPHLTVAECSDQAVLDRVAASVEPQLPVTTYVQTASVFAEDHTGRWHEHSRLPFGHSGVA